MAASWLDLAGRSRKSVQATSEAAPTLTTEGVLLESVAALSFWLEADSGETLGGDGQVDIYTYDAAFGWALSPTLVLQVPPGAAGLRRVLLGTVLVDNPVGRAAPIANGVTVSGGGVTIYARATVYGGASGPRAA